ncbi:hypothetical protein ILUMI_16778 [Ignelater luminosus]|uniref:Reverse transcriptase RNase H-like domain-containing protein n=1 Tax=Ignelater luminosus TaxID=2038154 RepID=A0A8K0G2J1_IGNLU|nr:hypothetical protein ILUMI_16778 [Ignelater luminosus]
MYMGVGKLESAAEIAPASSAEESRISGRTRDSKTRISFYAKQSMWTSSAHTVNRQDGTTRPCGDCRRLNDLAVPDRYPISRIEDFHHILKSKTIFSKIDLFKAYYQIPIAEEDKEKFNVFSFGLRNPPSTFQRFVNEKAYSTYDRELLGIYLSVRHFKHMLEGRDFTIMTDKPLTFAFKQKNDKHPQDNKDASFQFSTKIIHMNGHDNIITDTLSRIDEIKALVYDLVADAQIGDAELEDFLQNDKYPKPDERFDIIHIDIVRPLPPAVSQSLTVTPVG